MLSSCSSLPSKDVTAADSPYDLHLDATTLANIEVGNQGKYITISKIELVHSTTNSIMSVRSVANDDSAVYNLWGIHQNGKLQKGVYIKSGSKFVVR